MKLKNLTEAKHISSDVRYIIQLFEAEGGQVDVAGPFNSKSEAKRVQKLFYDYQKKLVTKNASEGLYKQHFEAGNLLEFIIQEINTDIEGHFKTIDHMCDWCWV